MQKVNLADVNEAGTSEQIVAGGYICKYTNVEDVQDKKYLTMEFDIVEGQYKEYFKRLNERAGFWGGVCRRSYSEKALPFFKRMCSAVSKSNPGYIFDGGEQNCDEKSLVGKFVGLIIGIEEYEKNNGDIGTRTYVEAEVPVDVIRKGGFKIPEKKTIERPASTSSSNGDFVKIPSGAAEELPFN